ncbi:glycoside hydrolase [Sinomicrobium soli]|uniref:hypothetical protein n=1 Tax=Sinomicrobium sp. N-1-3-6 TaxID=2219864 RepID=UPI0011BDBD4B|nr:hypothetical protein [Sinomicrobium sp. N-1-3-6]
MESKISWITQRRKMPGVLFILLIAFTQMLSMLSYSNNEELCLNAENSVSGECALKEYTGLLGQFDFTSGKSRVKPSNVKSGITISKIAIGNLKSVYTDDALSLSNWTGLNVGAGKWIGFEINSVYGFSYEIDSVTVVMRRSDNTPDRIRLSYGDDKQNSTQHRGVITKVGSSTFNTFSLGVNADKKPDQNTPYYAIGVQAGSRQTIVEFDKISVYGRITEVPLPTSGSYTLRFDQPQQLIKGLGVELQSDRFGPDYVNSDPVGGVPYELVDAEKNRFAKEMLSGFRYIRLAMGLWFRGQTRDGKNIVERYPGQAEGISDLIRRSGIEGVSAEYWSPASFWKESGKLQGGGPLKSLYPEFLDRFGDAVVQDLQYLSDHGIPVKMWGLQNEPNNVTNYAQTTYSNEEYYETFRKVAPKVRKAYPDVLIHVNSQRGQYGVGSELIKKDKEALQYVDGWSWHRAYHVPNATSDDLIDHRKSINRGTEGKPVFNNEFEYFKKKNQMDTSPEWRMVNTPQVIMNWMTFADSPTFFWLHALKPMSDGNSEGFALGVWRGEQESDAERFPDLQKGHFQYNWWNWNGIAGFLKHMPWDSRRYEVEEDEVLYNQRIMAWKRPDGKFVFALTNRSNRPFEFNIAMDQIRSFTGHRYDKDTLNQTLPSQSGSDHKITLEPWSIEFWVED